MNKKLQELKYDLDRETDEEKSHELIEDYVRVKKSKEKLDKFGTEPEYTKKPGNYWNPANKKKREASISEFKNIVDQAIGESDECDCDLCTDKIKRNLLEEQNNIAPLADYDKDIEYLKKEEISESEKIARKFHVLFNKAEDDEKNKLCEGKKMFRVDIDEMFVEDDYNERNREALNGLYGEGKYGKYDVQDARKVLRDAFADAPDFKHSYMANIRMFLNDRADHLIHEQIIYDLIDFILREEG